MLTFRAIQEGGRKSKPLSYRIRITSDVDLILYKSTDKLRIEREASYMSREILEYNCKYKSLGRQDWDGTNKSVS